MIGVYKARTKDEAVAAFDEMTRNIPGDVKVRIMNGTLTDAELNDEFLFVRSKAWEYIQEIPERIAA